MANWKSHAMLAKRSTLIFCLSLVAGCAAQRAKVSRPTLPTPTVVADDVRQAAHLAPVEGESEVRAAVLEESTTRHESLEELESQVGQNPQLRRLWSEYNAARAKVRYLGELPDPTIGANLFISPIETAAGSQRANLTLSQMLPWLPRLDARVRQACFEAAALRQVYLAERLRIVADIRTHWYRLYVLKKQIEINSANQELLESLIEVANSRVATGQASQGDVLAGTLEYSQLEEQNVALRQQTASTKSAINRLVGRDATMQIDGPHDLVVVLPDWGQPMLRSLAWERQPDIEAARIRSHATRWGVEVARLGSRPDFTLNASWFGIDDNRPVPNVVDVGRDAWAVGAMLTLPIRRDKYDGIEQESLWKHAATTASIEEVQQHYDALLFDLWEQARAADETARLYMDTIIPEARRALEADQEAYANGKVEFDRVVRDFRNLLTLEIGYHRSVGQLATARARIRQAVGGVL